MSSKSHPIPKVGDTVVLNDYGIQQCFNGALGLRHMKTLRMKITWVDSFSATPAPYLTYPVEVDDAEVTMFLIDHRYFDVVVEADRAACSILNDRPCGCGIGQCRQGQIY